VNYALESCGLRQGSIADTEENHKRSEWKLEQGTPEHERVLIARWGMSSVSTPYTWRRF